MAGFPPDYSTSGFRFFSRPFNVNNGVQSFQLLQDPNLVWFNGQTATTGGWRPIHPSDLAANISVSGLNLSVGAVQITGNPQMQVSTIVPVNVTGYVNAAVTGGSVSISNTPTVTIGNGVTPVSGNVTVLGGGALNVAITGGVVGTTSAATSVTGTVSVSAANGVLPVSGVVSATVTLGPIAITGSPTVTMVNPVAVTGSPTVTVGNGVVSVSGVTTVSNTVTVSVSNTPTVTVGNGVLPVSGVVTANSTITNGVVPISGVVQSTVTLGPIALTGAPVVTINNPLAITGLTVSTTSGPQAITGNVSVTPAGGVLAVSGVFNAAVTVNAISVTGSPQVTIGNALSVTGLTISTTVNTVAITGAPVVTVSNPLAVTGTHNVAVTGGSVSILGSVPVTDTTSWALLSGISGSLTSNLSAAAWVTGQVSITNGVVPVSGVFSASVTVNAISVTGSPVVTINNPIAVTGLTISTTVNTVAITGAPVVTINNPIAVTGLTVNTTLNTVSVTGAVTTTPLTGIFAVSGIVQANVTNVVPIPVSGVVAGTVAVSSVAGTVTVGFANAVAVTGTHNVAVTGGAINATIVGTPTVTVGNGVLAVSGVVTAGVSNPLGITGIAVDTSLPTINGFAPRFLPIGGKIAAATGAGSVTGYNNSGDMAMLNICQTNGGLFVNQGVLQSNQDCVTVTQSGNVVVSNGTVNGLTSTPQVVLTANASRIAWGISNFSTGALIVLMSGVGALPPSTGNMHWILQGGIATNDGKGGVYTDSPAVWQGAVAVSGVNPLLTLTYNAWQI